MKKLELTKKQREYLYQVLKSKGCKAAQKVASKYLGFKIHISTIPQMLRRAKKKGRPKKKIGPYRGIRSMHKELSKFKKIR